MNIWRTPVYLPYRQPPLTDDILNDAQAQLGVRLPTELVALLREQNGGYLRVELDDEDVPHSLITGIGPHYPSLLNVDWTEVQEYVDFQLDGLIPFDGDGHWHLCLDYRDSESPLVTFVDIECNEQKPIASSFGGYLSRLRIESDGEVVLLELPDVATAVAALEENLQVKFEQPDAWANGYDVYRLGLGTRSSPEWVWLSTNMAPRGFARKGERGYRQNPLPGEAPRYPELPDDAVLLSTTDGVRERVLAACASAGLDTRPHKDFLKAASPE